MPSNREYKGKGIKGRNYDEFSGFGSGSAGTTGTIDKLNDGGVGSPKLADSGNLQRAGGQPGETPAQGDSTRGPGEAARRRQRRRQPARRPAVLSIVSRQRCRRDGASRSPASRAGGRT